jgi:carboxyl-terminal processing protease
MQINFRRIVVFLTFTSWALTSAALFAAEKSNPPEVFWSDPGFWESSALKTPYKENLSNEEKVAGLAKFWSEVKYNFINFHLVKNLDWDKAFLNYIPKVLATKTTLEYYLVLQEFCALLKDGHTNVNAPEELDNQLFGKPLVAARLVESKVLIARIFDDKLRVAGLREGQEIVEIDGVPVKTYANEKLRPYVSDSTPQAFDETLYSRILFGGLVGKPVQLSLKAKDGNLFVVTLPRVSWQERAKIIKQPPPFEMKMLSGNVAYVAVNTMDGEAKANEAFARAFPEIEKSDALILDLRNNGGGDSDVAAAILAHLTDSPIAASTWYTRNYRPSFRAWNQPQEKYQPPQSENIISVEDVRKLRGANITAYSKPVIVLSGPRTGSAAEDFLVAFKPLKRGLVIGEPTNGSTGQPLPIHLPGGGSARICSKHDTFADGTPFVGIGVQPDITATLKISDVADGTDSVLALALAQIAKQRK